MKRFASLTDIVKPLAGDKGLRRAKTVYLAAQSRDGESHLLWLEEGWMGKRYSYPCAIQTPDTLLVYWPGNKERDGELAAWWGTLTREGLQNGYTVTQVNKASFGKKMEEYRRKEGKWLEG